MSHLTHTTANDDETLKELWKIKDETAHKLRMSRITLNI